MSRQGNRRSILKKRSNAKERLIALARRLGVVTAVGVAVVWVGAWVVLSGAGAAFINTIQQKTLHQSADMGFRVANVYIEGRHYTDADSIRAIVTVKKGDPLFSFDVAEARDQMERLSWVKSAEVKRQLPDTIYVRLVERQPFALWQRDGRLSVIDEEGVVLTDRRAAAFASLIILVGEGVPENAKAFLTMLAAEPSIYDQVEAATFISQRRWDLKLKNNMTVKLPEEDLGLALSRLAAAQAEERLLDKNIAGVDLREAGRLIIETHPGAVNDYLGNVAPAAGERI
jgi:cell division protein FtsQ